MGHPDFRVGKKIFATLSEKEDRAVLKLSPDEHVALVESQPDVFLSLGGWSRNGATGVVLRKVPLGVFCDLLVEAWRRTAPKRLVADFDAKDDEKAPPASKKTPAKKATPAKQATPPTKKTPPKKAARPKPRTAKKRG
jgi:hypothetical protein